VLEDTKKSVTNDQFEQGVVGIKGIIGARPASVAAQIP
jgi:hypothetical protein